MATSLYILNWRPTKSVEGMITFEAWYGKKPAVHHLCIFDCIANVRNTTPHLKNLEDRSRCIMFVGYDPVVAMLLVREAIGNGRAGEVSV